MNLMVLVKTVPVKHSEAAPANDLDGMMAQMGTVSSHGK